MRCRPNGSAARVYDVEDVSLSVGDRTVRRASCSTEVNWHVGPGDRIGIIGVNGSGKTHLLRLLAGELAPDAGRVVIGQTVRVGYLSQDVARTAGQSQGDRGGHRGARQSAEIGGVEQSASQLAERFGFANERQWTPVGDLSGGERRRLQLLRLLLSQPNVLLLDEPTNDLDTDTLAELEDLLDSWAGTLVVVSHDRYLVERVCDSTVALLGDGSVAALPGGIEEYLARRAASLRRRACGRLSRAGAEPAAQRKTDPRPVRKELARLEREIGKLERREAALHEALAEHATDYTRISRTRCRVARGVGQQGGSRAAMAGAVGRALIRRAVTVNRQNATRALST